jgi:hypothetical protein
VRSSDHHNDCGADNNNDDHQGADDDYQGADDDDRYSDHDHYGGAHDDDHDDPCSGNDVPHRIPTVRVQSERRLSDERRGNEQLLRDCELLLCYRPRVYQ